MVNHQTIYAVESMICEFPFSPPLIVSLAFMSEWSDDGAAVAAKFPFVMRTDAIGNVLIVLKLDSSRSR